MNVPRPGGPAGMVCLISQAPRRASRRMSATRAHYDRGVSYTVTVRVGPKVTRRRVPSVDDAIDVLELELRSLGDSAKRPPARAFLREISPQAQVSARGELSGPGRLRPSVRAGVDVRGDGSFEAYRGKVNRDVIEQQRRESAFDALRRVLGGDDG